MKKTSARITNLSRRDFIVGTAAAGGGLAIGIHLPFGFGSAEAKSAVEAGTEVLAWVVVKPDDTCVIRIARSEMGQGTLTGLAQLVAEELECDWKKVTTESITPGQNLARKRIWGEMSTGCLADALAQGRQHEGRPRTGGQESSDHGAADAAAQCHVCGRRRDHHGRRKSGRRDRRERSSGRSVRRRLRPRSHRQDQGPDEISAPAATERLVVIPRHRLAARPSARAAPAPGRAARRRRRGDRRRTSARP